MMEDEGYPIPLIEIEKDDDAKKFVFGINPMAISILQDLKDKKVGVLVIAGPQRSGKSFLANRVLDKIKGFQLGSSVQPCTKGIWMWSQPIKLSPDHDFETIVLDTEGLNSVQRDATIDSKIFTLSLLLSSTFLYNSLGHIDENALDNLSLVVNLAKYIDASKEGEVGQTDFSTFFPNFFWVLRDFALDLRGKTANEYLDSCLKPIEGNSTEIQKKNQIRTTINNYFKHRSCHCLIRPVNEEKLLQRIEEVPIEKMKKEFLQGLDLLKERMIVEMRPKIIDGKVLTANMLLNLTFEYVEALNNESAPNIHSTLERIIYTETRKICDDVLVEFCEHMDEEFDDGKLPVEEDVLRRRYKELYASGIKKFETMTKEFAEVAQLIDLRDEIVEKMEVELENKLQRNDEISQALCKKFINELFNTFNLPALLSLEDIRESLIMEYKQKFLSFYDNYKRLAKGVHKYELFADFTPNFLFEFFEKFQTNVARIHQEEFTDLKTALNQARAGEESLRNTLVEYYENIMQFQKERNEMRDELEKKIRENNLKSQLAEEEILSLQDKVREITEKLARKKEKYRDLKRNNGSMDINHEKLKDENAYLKKKLESLQGKYSELEKTAEMSRLDQSSVRQSNPTLPELNGFIGDLSRIVGSLAPVEKMSINNERLSSIQAEKEKEIVLLKKEFDRRLNESWERQKRLKEDYQRDLDRFKKQLESQANENAKLKVEVIDFSNALEALKKKETMIDGLKRDLNAVSEEYDLKKKDYGVSVEVTELFKERYEELQLRLQELEGKIAEQHHEITKLNTHRDDILWASKNALKKALGQKHLLRSALQSLDSETANDIRDMLREVSIKIDY